MKYIISKEHQGKTVKELLKHLKISSGLMKRLKRLEDGITVNGSHQNVNFVLKENDVVELRLNDMDEDTNEFLLPVDIPIDIIYEDENITVVNKPPNMPTHQSLNNHGNTLANALRFRYREKPYVFRATNRLDKDTSGVVITANNRLYASILSDKIKNGKVKKEYIAIVKGKITNEGVIDAPIGRIGQSIIKRIVRQDGERAVTAYKPLAYCDEISILSVTPITGRTHQIRVHMCHIGHPIIGDGLYFENSEFISRQALHCAKMEIDEIGSFVAPLPVDMRKVIGRYFTDEEISF